MFNESNMYRVGAAPLTNITIDDLGHFGFLLRVALLLATPLTN